MNISKLFYVEHQDGLKEVAIYISDLLLKQKVLCLNGDLGSGKTTLTKYVISSLCNYEVEVTSPTFNLVHIYDSNYCKIWHYDLYRLKHIDEIHELGIEDAFNDLCIIEWPQIIEPILPLCYINVNVEFGENDYQRKIKIAYKNKKG